MNEVLQVKVVFLGDTGVGKTCIINRFAHNTFNEVTDSTLGAIFKSKIIDYPEIDTGVRYQIWDTAGQEMYRSLSSMYYREAAVAILVYDITSKKTFETLNYWAEKLTDRAPEEIKIVIVGNKGDLLEYEEVSIEEAKKYAEDTNASFALTSAKDETGIKELFDSILVQLKLRNSKGILVGNNNNRHNLKNEKFKLKKCC